MHRLANSVNEYLNVTLPVPLGGAVQVNGTLFFSAASLWVTPVPYMWHINVINYYGPDVLRISYPNAGEPHLRVSREVTDGVGPARLSCLHQQSSVLLSTTCQDHCEERARKHLIVSIEGHGNTLFKQNKEHFSTYPSLGVLLGINKTV